MSFAVVSLPVAAKASNGMVSRQVGSFSPEIFSYASETLRPRCSSYASHHNLIDSVASQQPSHSPFPPPNFDIQKVQSPNVHWRFPAVSSLSLRTLQVGFAPLFFLSGSRLPPSKTTCSEVFFAFFVCVSPAVDAIRI